MGIKERKRGMQFEEFQTLVKKHVPNIFSVAFTLTLDYFESERITESVFAQAYKARGKLSLKRPAEQKAWLVSEAAKISSAYLLSRRCDRRIAELESHPGSPSFESEISSLSGVTGLAEKLSQMPQREKDAAYSYYILSESVMEHSSKAGISYLSARRSLDKARERIRKSLLAQTREPDWQG